MLAAPSQQFTFNCLGYFRDSLCKRPCSFFCNFMIFGKIGPYQSAYLTIFKQTRLTDQKFNTHTHTLYHEWKEISSLKYHIASTCASFTLVTILVFYNTKKTATQSQIEKTAHSFNKSMCIACWPCELKL